MDVKQMLADVTAQEKTLGEIRKLLVSMNGHGVVALNGDARVVVRRRARRKVARHPQLSASELRMAVLKIMGTKAMTADRVRQSLGYRAKTSIYKVLRELIADQAVVKDGETYRAMKG